MCKTTNQFATCIFPSVTGMWLFFRSASKFTRPPAASASNKLHMTTKQSAIMIAQVEYRISTGWKTTLISTFTCVQTVVYMFLSGLLQLWVKVQRSSTTPNQTKYATRMG
jgi:hypothetical protein